MHNSFWLQDVKGRKLPDAQAELVAERLQDFVVYCTPNDAIMQEDRFTSGPVTVSARPPPRLPWHGIARPTLLHDGAVCYAADDQILMNARSTYPSLIAACARLCRRACCCGGTMEVAAMTARCRAGNSEHAKNTVITVIATKAQRQRSDFLLELASALNGCAGAASAAIRW